MITQRFARVEILTIAVCCLALVSGCSKKESQPSTSAVVPPAEQPVQAAAPVAPVSPTAAQSASPAPLQDVQSALKAKQYDQAATVLINYANTLSKQSLTPEQAGPALAQMHQLHQSLINAAASGDPGAIAAMQRVNQAMPH